MRLFIAAPSQLLRASILNLLTEVESLTIVGSASSVSGSLDGTSRMRPDVVLLDARLCEACGIDLPQLLRAAQPTLRIVLLADMPSARARNARHDNVRGADACVWKPNELGRLPSILSELGVAS